MKTKPLTALLTALCLLLSAAGPLAQAADPPAASLTAAAPITDQEIRELVSQAKALALGLSREDRAAISQRLAPTYFSLTERQDMEAQMKLSNSDPKIVDALQKEQLDHGPFAITNQQLADLLERFLPDIIRNTVPLNELQSPAKYCEEVLTLNAKPFLAGFLYLNRLFNFTMGTTNLRDVLFECPQVFGKSVSTMGWILDTGIKGIDWQYGALTGKLAFNKVGESFRELFQSITDAPDLPAFLEECQERFMPDRSLAEWFPTAGYAYIAERHFASGAIPAQETALYTKLAQGGTASHAQLLALLTAPENSVYAISTPSTITYGLVEAYQERGPALQRKLEQTADEQMAYLNFWERMLRPETDRHTMVRNVLVYDSLSRYDQPHVQISLRWQTSRSTMPGMQAFFIPLGMYAAHTYSDAQASENSGHGGSIRFWNVLALDERGSSTFSHELTHLFEDDVWMEQPRREDMGGETYTRGLFETYYKPDEPVLNLNLLYEAGHDRDPQFRNSSPERFQSPQELQDYMQGLFDVLYTLDYAEGQAALTFGTQDRQKLFHKFLQHPVPEKTYMTEEIRALTPQEAEQLHTVEDLVEQDIVSARYEIGGLTTVGTRGFNSYDVVPLFSANYAAPQNPNGISGGITVRRYAHELLAEYGYYGGMVPYISNQYKADAEREGVPFSDPYILGRVSQGAFSSMAQFRKAMFQRRYEQRDRLRPVTVVWQGQTREIQSYEELQQLLREALALDLKNNPLTDYGWPTYRAFRTQTEQLKAAVFAAYLESTEEFRTSIYQEPAQPVLPPVCITAVSQEGLEVTVNRPGLTGTLIAAGYRASGQLETTVFRELTGAETVLTLRDPALAQAQRQRLFVLDAQGAPIS